MKKLARKKKNDNVLSIADNPRFKEAKTIQMAVPKGATGDDFFCIEMHKNMFGYSKGTVLICREKFSLSEIERTTLVIIEGSCLGMGETEGVTGIVDYIQIDLRRMK